MCVALYNDVTTFAIPILVLEMESGKHLSFHSIMTEQKVMFKRLFIEILLKNIFHVV